MSVIRRWRKEAGLTQVDAAQMARISQGYYSRIETGVCVPSLYVVKRIARAFGRDVGEAVAEIVKERGDHVGDV